MQDKNTFSLSAEPKIFEYSNGAVVFMIPEKVKWVKTSSTGKWIFDQIRDNNHNMDSIMQATCDFYQLPIQEVKRPVKALLDEFITSGIISGTDTVSHNEPLNLDDFGLQQVWINITSYCNYRCKHCYQLDHDEQRSHMPVDLAKSIIDQAADLDVHQLVFSGGEPTLHPHFFEIAAYARKNFNKGIKLITNGTLQKDSEIKKLVEYFDDIQISVDGINARTNDKIRGEGAFEKVTKIFHKINKIDPEKSVGISFTPLPENLDSIPELYNLAIYFRAKYLHLNRPKPPASVSSILDFEEKKFMSNEFFRETLNNYFLLLKNIFQEMELNIGLDKLQANMIDSSFDPAGELLKPIKKQRCAAGILTIAINEKGECFPCSALSRSKSYGNMHNDTLKNIYAGLREEMMKAFSVDKNASCADCEYRYFCGGGCRATGAGIEEHDILCETLKNRYEIFLQNLAKPMTKPTDNEDGVKVINEDEHILQPNC